MVMDLELLLRLLLPVQLSENLYTQRSVRNKPLSTVGRAFFSQGFPSVCGQINCKEVLTHFKIWGNRGRVLVKNGSHARMRKEAGSLAPPSPLPNVHRVWPDTEIRRDGCCVNHILINANPRDLWGGQPAHPHIRWS